MSLPGILLLLPSLLLAPPPRTTASVKQAPQAKPALPSEVTPTNVEFSGLRRIDDNGAEPDCSPVEDLVAYQRIEKVQGLERAAIWIADLSGGRKQKIAAEGTRPAWSPDGKRLVFLDGRALMVWDKGSQRTVKLLELDPEFGLWNLHPRWTINGQQLILNASILDLDSLKLTRNSAINSAREADWLRANQFERRHPNLLLWISEHTPDGLWTRNAEGSYRRLLSPGLRQGFALSSDLTRIVLAGSTPGGWGLFVATLVKGPGNATEFAVPIGRDTVLEAFNYAPSMTSRGGPEECLRGRSIFAPVGAPRVNPLTEKVIGIGASKGTLRVTKVSPRYAIVSVTIQTDRIAPGDVMGAMFAANSESRGCGGKTSVHEWAVLEPVTPQALVDATEISFKDEADRGSARGGVQRAACGDYAPCLSEGMRAFEARDFEKAILAFRGATVAAPSQKDGWENLGFALLSAGRPQDEVVQVWDQLLKDGNIVFLPACRRAFLGCDAGMLGISKEKVAFDARGKTVFSVLPAEISTGELVVQKFLSLDRVAFPLKIGGKLHSFEFIPPGAGPCMNETDLSKCVKNAAYQQRVVATYVLATIPSLK